MGGSQLKILSDEGLDAIHLAALNVLEHTGVAIHLKKALDILKEAGAEVDYERKIAKIPPYLVDEAIRKTPKKITLYGRDPKYKLEVDKESMYFGSLGEASHFLNMDTGECSLITIKDLERATTVSDALDNISWIAIGIPSDVPAQASDRYGLLVSLKNTTKHIACSPYDAEGVNDAIKMASAIMGSEKKLKRKPIISFPIFAVSPLTYSEARAEVLIEAAEHGLPICIASGSIAGGTSPVTLAGSLVITHAEILSGLLMVQLTGPGTPVIYETTNRTMDMKTGGISVGSPEFALLRCSAKMARYCNLVSKTGGFISDSKIPDEQAGYDMIMTGIFAALNKANMIFGGFLEANNMISCEQLVIFDEATGIVSRLVKGIEVNDDTLAVDVINKVGPGGHYLTQEHTIRYLRKEIFIPNISSDRTTCDVWKKAGAKDAWQRAKAKAKEILVTHKPKPLPEDIEEEITKIAAEAEGN